MLLPHEAESKVRMTDFIVCTLSEGGQAEQWSHITCQWSVHIGLVLLSNLPILFRRTHGVYTLLRLMIPASVTLIVTRVKCAKAAGRIDVLLGV